MVFRPNNFDGSLIMISKPVCSTCIIVPYMALFHVLTTGRWVCFLLISRELWMGVVLTTGRWVCFLLISRELWMGVNRSVIAKLLNQANKSWVYKEAWYSFFKFLTQMATLPGHRLLIIGEICDYIFIIQILPQSVQSAFWSISTELIPSFEGINLSKIILPVFLL